MLFGRSVVVRIDRGRRPDIGWIRSQPVQPCAAFKSDQASSTIYILVFGSSQGKVANPFLRNPGICNLMADTAYGNRKDDPIRWLI